MMAPRIAGAVTALSLIIALPGASPLRAAGQPEPVATDSVDRLARDVDRLESLRAVKTLQRTYAQYAQYGRWTDMAALFAEGGRIEWGDRRIEGRAAIADWAMRRSGGATPAGLAPGALDTELIEEPLVNLSPDGKSARGRWMSLSFLGDGKGHTRIEGGIYENDYVREGGRWKIATAHYYPQYEGSYADGWTNVGGRELPVVPAHFTPDETGVPIPPAQGPAPASGASLTELEQRIALLNDEDAVRNVQNAYGYYVDRKMWDDVVDLFAGDCAVEIGGSGPLRGRDGVRKALIAHMGAAGLHHGELNDHPLFDTVVHVLPGGREAESRGIEIAMLGDADKGQARWEISVFRNRFVKEDGLWKLKELRIVPVMKADYHVGWGEGGLGGPRRPSLPAFLTPNPATGNAVATGAETIVAATPLTGAIAASPAAPSRGLADARRRLRRSLAYDGVENVSAAYGYYLDDFQWTQMGQIFAANANKQSPFAGYYLGADRIKGALNATWGPPSPLRAGISFHWRIQPVIHVSHDGRSANLRTRLFQPRTYKVANGSGFYTDGINSGMYPNDQAVLEKGIWRLWSITIDEPYFTSPNWKGGWSAAREPTGDTKPRPSPLLKKYPPDIPITALGRREEGFRGGTGKTITWPGILPMWFHYRNPVSGRVPTHYWPDCVPCTKLPQASMTHHGYEMPPTGPEIDGVDVTH